MLHSAVGRIRQSILASLLPLFTSWTGCSGDGTVGPDAAVDALVGDRTAADVNNAGATLGLVIQPSGPYAAILILNARAQTGVGRIEVSGNKIALRSHSPGCGGHRRHLLHECQRVPERR